MKNLVNYNPDFLSFGYVSLKRMSLVTSLVGSSMAANSQERINQQNAQLTREGWAQQSLEAEKARKFNAEEAEKERQFYSEGAVMERRKEAGLNTALSGSDSATTGASASTSAPSLSAPIPMESEAPVALSALDTLSRLRVNNSEIALKAEQAKGLALDNLIKDETKDITIESQNATLESLKGHIELNNKQIEQLDQTIKIEREHATQARMASYVLWRKSETEIFNSRVNAIQSLDSVERFERAFAEEKRRYWLDISARIKASAYAHGNKKISKSSSDSRFNISNSSEESSKYDLNMSGGMSASGIAGFSLHGGTNYSSSSHESSGISELNGISSGNEYHAIIEQIPLARLSARALAVCDELDKHTELTPEARDMLIDELRSLNTSYDLYLFEMSEITSNQSRDIFQRF